MKSFSRKVAYLPLVILLAGSCAGALGDRTTLAVTKKSRVTTVLNGNAATFVGPQGVAVGPDGTLYVTDGNKIRKISPAGVVTTLAGTGAGGEDDGPGSTATFNEPVGITLDTSGNLYVAEYSGNRIRKITPDGTVSTFAGVGFLSGPIDLMWDSGNLWLADQQNNLIRLISSAGAVNTFAGTGGTSYVNGGATTTAQFYWPSSAVVVGSAVYVTDMGNQTIRKIESGNVTTFTGTPGSDFVDGSPGTAKFNGPSGMAADSSGNLYVMDWGNNAVRMVVSDGTVSTVAGTGSPGYQDGPAATAMFDYAQHLAVDGSGAIYVADDHNRVIRKISGGQVTTVAGVYSLSASQDGINSARSLSVPAGIVFDKTGNLYLADTGHHVIRKITPGGVNTVLAGDPSFSNGSADGQGTAARFSAPNDIDIDSLGNLYVADFDNGEVRKIDTTGLVSTIATGFAGPCGLAVSAKGIVYVADTVSNCLFQIVGSAAPELLAGNGAADFVDGRKTDASFRGLTDVVAAPDGYLYVADQYNHAIRKVTPDGIVTTVAGSPPGTPVPGFVDGQANLATFYYPSRIAAAPDGSLYVTDSLNNAIRRISGGVVSTIAGKGSTVPPGFADGGRDVATFTNPNGVAVAPDGSLYVTDQGSNRIRKITLE